MKSSFAFNWLIVRQVGWMPGDYSHLKGVRWVKAAGCFCRHRSQSLLTNPGEWKGSLLDPSAQKWQIIVCVWAYGDKFNDCQAVYQGVVDPIPGNSHVSQHCISFKKTRAFIWTSTCLDKFKTIWGGVIFDKKSDFSTHLLAKTINNWFLNNFIWLDYTAIPLQQCMACHDRLKIVGGNTFLIFIRL